MRLAWLSSADCTVRLVAGGHGLAERKVADHGVGRRAQQARALRERAVEHRARRGKLADRMRLHDRVANRGQRKHDGHTLGERHQGNDQNEQSVLEATQRLPALNPPGYAW